MPLFTVTDVAHFDQSCCIPYGIMVAITQKTVIKLRAGLLMMFLNVFCTLYANGAVAELSGSLITSFSFT